MITEPFIKDLKSHLYKERWLFLVQINGKVTEWQRKNMKKLNKERTNMKIFNVNQKIFYSL